MASRSAVAEARAPFCHSWKAPIAQVFTQTLDTINESYSQVEHLSWNEEDKSSLSKLLEAITAY